MEGKGIKEQIAGKMQAWIIKVKGRLGLFMYKANSAWIFKTVPSI